eukprot:scaffold85613_cov57-Phaeocystis_antarctica.AAC.2
MIRYKAVTRTVSETRQEFAHCNAPWLNLTSSGIGVPELEGRGGSCALCQSTSTCACMAPAPWPSGRARSNNAQTVCSGP